MSTADLEEDLALAVSAARAAGATVLRRFRGAEDVRYKGPGEPVTETDLLADRILRETLTSARPRYGWLSEETADDAERLERERVWIVDPIDGTRAFVDGEPEFAVCVGLAERGRAVLGVVFNPARDRLYHAVLGGGAFADGHPVHVAPDRSDGERTLLLSPSELPPGGLPDPPPGWTVRTPGSTAWRTVLVAEGAAHGYVSPTPKREWDLCAASRVVEEAGGRITDARGGPLRFNRPETIVHGVVVATPGTHAELLRWSAEGTDGTTASGDV